MSKALDWLKEEYGGYGKKLANSLARLSDKDRAFCEAYVETGSPYKAADAADMRHQSPALLLHVPKYAAYINILTAKKEVDLGRASTKEMLERIRATPVLTEDSSVLPAELLQEIQAQLSEGALVSKTEEELLGNIEDGAEANFGIMQVPAVKLLHSTEFGPEWIIEQIVRVAERCLQVEPVYDKKGNPIGSFEFQPTPALRALELLGKTLAMFKDDVPVKPIDQRSAQEIDARIRALTGNHPELLKLLEDASKIIEHDPSPSTQH